MTKDQPRRMQEVTARWKTHQLAPPASAVSIVPDDRMPDLREMNTDLMRASRIEMRPEQIGGIEAREPGQIRPGRPSSTDDCHALSVSRVAGDRTLDRNAFF